ncbi:guanine nucleotide exchange factor for rab-3a isoform x1 [Limosa lapponica baueri]|uniref:Guanine nucleotide exchange factor for rab-3a isoform x1 n=1 Tax=Limosa lapponica baueri TaxID=1758121 RepID=A0A2I0TI31_LIMLA|nr:guanine nucleotide exchange factor for rab-3a isoform x1 [Limosa lapponica baueri]
MDTRITMSNLPAFGVVSGGEAEDGAAETREGAAAVCEGLEGIPPPGGKPRAMARKGHGRNKSTSSAMVSAASQNVTPEPVSHERKEVVWLGHQDTSINL